MDDVPVRTRDVHGYQRAYRILGRGTPLLLIHGIGDNSATWLPVMRRLARHHTVIAPDLLGHGASDKPRADYSVAAYANGMRDLLGVLGIDRVTLVGHSFGGGVAMQFAYQFPERSERLVLVATGGVEKAVTPFLRAVSVPGAHHALLAPKLPGGRTGIRLGLKVMALLGTGLGRDADDLVRLVDALPDATARSAFVRTLRGAVDWRGQVVTMLDRCYLTRGMPTLLMWGTKDSVLPVRHARIAHAAMPHSRLELFDGAGHFPFHHDPDRFVDLLEDFIDTTEAADWSDEQWRQLLRGAHGPVPPARHEALRLVSERSAT